MFDLVGTLVRDTGFSRRATARALAAAGIQATEREVHNRSGRSRMDVFRELAFRGGPRGCKDPTDAESRARSALDAFRRGFADELRRTAPEPAFGARETFAYLRAHGIRVAATTGLDRASALRLLRPLGWHNGWFDALIFSDDVPMGRPAPYMIFRAMESVGVTRVRAVVKVGDTPADLLEGTHAGASGVVGVTSGAFDVAPLRACPHTHLIESVADFPELFARQFTHARARESLPLVIEGYALPTTA